MVNAIFFFFLFLYFGCLQKLTASFYRLGSDLVTPSDREREQVSARLKENTCTIHIHAHRDALNSHVYNRHTDVRHNTMAAIRCRMSKCRCLCIGQHELRIECHLLRYIHFIQCIARCVNTEVILLHQFVL